MIYYNFEYDGDIKELQADSPEAAEKWANEWFAERCEQCGERKAKDEGYIVEVSLDNNDEPWERGRDKIALEYEYYHGDFAEHNTWGL